MDLKNTNQTFNINDLCSSSEKFLTDKSSKNFFSNIQNELELSEMYQKQRISHKFQKRLYYQNEIENLRKKLKEPLCKLNDLPFNETISNTKFELQNSQSLSKNLNQILKDEYALKSRISENQNSKKSQNLRNTDEIEIELQRLKFSKPQEQIKTNNNKEFEETSEKSNMKKSEKEDFQIQKPNHPNPFKNVFENKKKCEEKKKKNLDEVEKKKLFNQYLKLLKAKKNMIESTGRYLNHH